MLKKSTYKYRICWSNLNDPFLITFKLYAKHYIIITPKRFNKTVSDENVHVMQHISFIFVGLVGLLPIRSLGESYQIFLILIL